jgi:competence protein ComEA
LGVPTPAERQALLFVAAVAALGVAVRGGRALSQGGGAPEGAPLAAQIAAVDSAVAQGGRPRGARQGRSRPAAGPPPAPLPAERSTTTPGVASAGPVDVDRATVEELDRLPGIGPALAQRIVADRQLRGPFGGLEGLQEVRGIGPALAAKLAPHVTFSGAPRRRAPHP